MERRRLKAGVGAEIEWLQWLSRDRMHEITNLRAEVASLTERLTITDEKVEAAYAKLAYGLPSALRAAGMIDPEVEG